MGVDRFETRADDRDAELDQQGTGEQRRRRSEGRVGLGERILQPSDVSNNEDVKHHHRAGIDDHLCRRQEFRTKQEEEDSQRDQVDDEREDAVEGVALQDDARGTAHCHERRDPEDRYLHRLLILPP